MITLREHLDGWAGASVGRRAIAEMVAAIADASAELAGFVALGPLAGDMGAVLGASDDGEKALDVRANDLFLGHLRCAPVAAVVSEELPQPAVLSPSAPVTLAMGPLDGSNNVDSDAPMGTAFSLMPSECRADPALAFSAAGDRQLAAGFVLYGTYTAMVLTLGAGVQVFVLDPRRRVFRRTRADVRIPEARREYAINGSNARHWPLPICAFVVTDDQIKAQVAYCQRNGWAVNIVFTDDPHPRNTYWDMWGNPMFDLKDPAAVMCELAECRKVHGGRAYIRVSAFDASAGRESLRLSFITDRPEEEPGFALERQETGGRSLRYTTRAYAADKPSGARY